MYGGPDAASVSDDHFAPPDGLFVVGVLDGVAVATGGWRRHGDPGRAEAEIKRMYVVPAERGQGLARRVLAELERTASGAEVRRLVLNTGQLQQPAIALYRSAGYEPAPAFGHYAGMPGAVFLGKDLTDRA